MTRKRKTYAGLACALLVSASVFTGCGSDAELAQMKQENEELKSQVESLTKENADLKGQVAMYVPNEQTADSSPASLSTRSAPVELAELSFVTDIATHVSVKFKNVSQKTIDGVEFVILQFDNFGRPAYRFDNISYGNVSGELTMQGAAAPGDTLHSGWIMFNIEKTTKGKVVVKQVHFTDGAVWTNNHYDEEIKKEKEKMED